MLKSIKSSKFDQEFERGKKLTFWMSARMDDQRPWMCRSRREHSIWYLICDIRSYDHSVIIDQNLDGWDDSKNKERKPNLMWPPHAASSQCGHSPSPSRSLPLTDGRKPPLSPSYCSLKIQGRKYGKGREKEENGFRRTRRSRRGAYIASSPPLAHCYPRGNPR